MTTFKNSLPFAPGVLDEPVVEVGGGIVAIADNQDSVVQVHPIVKENATITYAIPLYIRFPFLCFFRIQRPNS
jgi:hypothetical protein